MRITDALIVVGIHAAVFALALIVVINVKPDMPELALVVAAVIGTWTEAFLWHRRQPASAPFSVKATLGGVMAIMCIIECLIAQSIWQIMSVPEVAIPISALGTFGFPFVIFGTFESSLQRKG